MTRRHRWLESLQPHCDRTANHPSNCAACVLLCRRYHCPTTGAAACRSPFGPLLQASLMCTHGAVWRRAHNPSMSSSSWKPGQNTITRCAPIPSRTHSCTLPSTTYQASSQAPSQPSSVKGLIQVSRVSSLALTASTSPSLLSC